MFFFDEADELEAYQTFCRQEQSLELEYEKIRIAPRDAHEALRINCRNEAMKGKVAEPKERMALRERRAPGSTMTIRWNNFFGGHPNG